MMALASYHQFWFGLAGGLTLVLAIWAVHRWQRDLQVRFVAACFGYIAMAALLGLAVWWALGAL